MRDSWTNMVAAAVLASGVFSVAAVAEDSKSEAKPETERCAGIVKAGQNDCGANDHACHAKAKVDRDPNEWIKLPKGLCERIAGGRVLKK